MNVQSTMNSPGAVSGTPDSPPGFGHAPAAAGGEESPTPLPGGPTGPAPLSPLKLGHQLIVKGVQTNCNEIDNNQLVAVTLAACRMPAYGPSLLFASPPAPYMATAINNAGQNVGTPSFSAPTESTII